MGCPRGRSPLVSNWQNIFHPQEITDWDAKQGRAPGDLGWKPPLLTSPGDAEKTKKRLNAEIANGRLPAGSVRGAGGRRLLHRPPRLPHA